MLLQLCRPCDCCTRKGSARDAGGRGAKMDEKGGDGLPRAPRRDPQFSPRAVQGPPGPLAAPLSPLPCDSRRGDAEGASLESVLAFYFSPGKAQAHPCCCKNNKYQLADKIPYFNYACYCKLQDRCGKQMWILSCLKR